MTSRKQHRTRGESGYTLVELIVVVAIIVALLVVGVIAIATIQKELRQRELDSKAETIYMAAQARMSELRASGYEDIYQYDATNDKKGVNKVGLVPYDADPDDTSLTADTLCYVESPKTGSTATTAAASLLPTGSVDEELRSNEWHIEFNPESGSVYAVYYSEESPAAGGVDATASAIPTDANELDRLRIKRQRIAKGATVGYYGGGSADTSSTDALYPGITVENKEKLKVIFYSNNPSLGENLTFDITLADGKGGTYKRTVTNLERVSSRTYRYVWVLDSLESSSTRFYEQTEHQLACGTDLKIELTVKSTDPMVDAATVDRTTNSLFDYRSGTASDTALVSYGRHLQNLDENSHVTSAITKAVQVSDISFADDATNGEDWYTLYGSNFTPIQNTSLASYDGKSSIDGTEMQTAIRSLHVKNSSGSQAGLFRTFAGKVANVVLTGTRIDQGSDVGALVGATRGDTTLEICQVYLSARNGDLDGVDAQESVYDVAPWLSGNVVGGLVGRAASGSTLTMNSSFASTVERADAQAGGLVGAVDGTVAGSGVYADGYLVAGSAAGGLFGGCDGSVSLEDFYSAGYVAAPTAAGIVPGGVDSASRGYSACSFVDASTTYSTAQWGGMSDVYFLTGGNSIDGTTQLSYDQLSADSAVDYVGSAFTAYSGSSSYPYNLMEQGLTTYSYPRLSALAHYGDWQAEFESGKLVYCERYADGSYGFQGANVSTLKSGQQAVGDGYAVAYTQSTLPSGAISVKYEGGSQYYLGTSDPIVVSDSSETYCLVPLTSDACNPSLGTGRDSFYTKLTVSDPNGNADFYFNPYFAKTVRINDTTPAAPDTISVRTARQLNALSKYYPKYDLETAGKTYSQELDIDYTTYMWSEYAGLDSVNKQAPITATGGFGSTYNGGSHTIYGVSIESYAGDTGLFGTVASGGALRNVLLVGRAGTDTVVRRTSAGTAASGASRSSQVGALAGVNRGTISNCAVCGYSMTYYGYNSNVLSMGGLVGSNSGSIRSCSADAYSISVTSYRAYAYVGGFVGSNNGTISSSYSTGHVGVLEARNSTVWAAGFAGSNAGGLASSCYSATAVVGSGVAETYGFARVGGGVSDCRYLDGGTYSYAGSMYAYNTSANEYAREGLAAGTAITGTELQSLSMSGFGAAAASWYHDQTSGSYPYPASVTASGQRVHLGNWPVQEFIGTVGMFYWEYEEYGSNSGYHFSYIGYGNNGTIQGDSLCEEHDDGGVVESYGYGYFYQTGSSAPTLTAGSFNLGNVNSEAGSALHDQMPDYTFVAYETGEGSSKLHLTSTSRNGTWTLAQSASDGANSYSFAMCPFFANAMSLDSIRFAGSSTTQSMSNAAPGEKGNTYEIRSEAQLQFMNWNSSKQTASYSITSSNYNEYSGSAYVRNRYPYLLSGDPSSIPSIPSESEMLYWEQSHDVDAYAENGNQDVTYTPIGSMYDGDSNSANAKPYVAFFPYSFDGQAYAIKNVAISSMNQAVGLFGVTAGAQLQNIVMYSDRGNQIVKESGGFGWYTMGGLVGFAGSRKASASSETSSFFKNCTVSGYTIIDRYGQDPGWGGGNVGGLVGTTNMDINNCSAVNDIELRITYNGSYKNLRVGGVAGVCRATINSCYAGGSIESYDEQDDKGDSSSACIWVGGVCGGIVVRSTGKLADLLGYVDRSLLVTNCYSYVDLPAGPSYAGQSGYKHVRASMSIASNGEMLVNWFGRNDNPSSDAYVPARHVYIYNSYALGSAVSSTTDYKNYSTATSFNNKDLNPLDSGSSKCHVYMYNDSTPYLNYAEMSESMLDKLNTTVDAKYDYISAYRTTWTTTSTTEVQETGNFGTVTTTEHGVQIDGKYSFPGNDTELNGLNYPFPTVLTQTNVFGDTVNVHYGAWPKLGIYWEKPSFDFNLYGNRQADPDTGETVSLMQMKLRVYGTVSGTLTADGITFTDDEGNELSGDDLPLEVYSVSGYTQESSTQGYYTVTFKGLREGTAYVHAKVGDNATQTIATVDNTLTIKASASKLELEPGEEKAVELTFYAPDSTGAEQQIKPEAGKFAWNVEVKSGNDVVICDNDSVSYSASTGVLTVSAIGRVVETLASGEAHVAIACTYTYGSSAGEQMAATQNLLVEVASPDFACLKVDGATSGYSFWRYASGGSDVASIGALASALGDSQSALYVRNDYTGLGNVSASMFALRVDGKEYAANSQGYVTIGGQRVARIVLGSKVTNSTYGYSYYPVSIEGYSLSGNAVLGANVRSDVSLEVEVSPEAAEASVAEAAEAAAASANAGSGSRAGSSSAGAGASGSTGVYRRFRLVQ